MLYDNYISIELEKKIKILPSNIKRKKILFIISENCYVQE